MGVKSILISMNPKWCELIASGEKTIEVRKTKPRLETPFKVYIYCTKNNRKYALHTYINSGCGRKKFGIIGHWRSGKDVVDVNSHLSAHRYSAYLAEGKVIGEFVCDTFVIDRTFGHDALFRAAACMSDVEAAAYCTNSPMYGWHISDLVIYDKPRGLSEFRKPEMPTGLRYENDTITRPPQSWCYVEEVHNG